MRPSHTDREPGFWTFNAKSTLVAVVLFAAVLAVPFLDLPHRQQSWVAYSEPNPMQNGTATTTATVTLTPTLTGTATASPTSTSTASPTGTSTASPTATSTASPTATSTATPTVTVPPPSGRLSLSVRVFVDFRCDRFFVGGRDRALANVPVTLTFASGATIEKNTSADGFAFFSGFGVPDWVTVSVELPSDYYGRGLGPCDNSPTSITLTAADFGVFSYKFLDFRAIPQFEIARP